MESEYFAASEAAKEVIWFRALLTDLGHTQTNATIMYEDNKAFISYSKNSTCHDRTKHIDMRAYWLRDCVRDGHVQTNDQLADMMTKTQMTRLTKITAIGLDILFLP